MSNSVDVGIQVAGYVVAMVAGIGLIRIRSSMCRVMFLVGLGALLLGALVATSVVPAAALPAHP